MPRPIKPTPSALGPTSRIVAAGRIRADGIAGGPTLGGLRVVGIQTGQVEMTFNGYMSPTANHQYIVKALACSNPAVTMPTVAFHEFRAEGFVLRLRSDSTPALPIELIRGLEMMIEVTEIME